MPDVGNAVRTPDGAPLDASDAVGPGSTPVTSDPVVLPAHAVAALTALRERAQRHEAHFGTDAVVEAVRPEPVVVERASVERTVVEPELVGAMSIVEHRRILDEALATAQAEAAAVVAAARAEAVSLIADAVSSMRNSATPPEPVYQAIAPEPSEPEAPVVGQAVAIPAPVTVVLDSESFARAFAAAIAAILEQRPNALGTEAPVRPVIDVGAGFIPAAVYDRNVQGQAAGRPVYMQAPHQKGFLANAWHPDVMLSVLAMIIVLVILLAFAA